MQHILATCYDLDFAEMEGAAQVLNGIQLVDTPKGVLYKVKIFN